MSNGPKIPLMVAAEYASHILTLILPSCRRVAVAGSVRRRKAECGDFEIVCIPADSPDLFGTILWPPEPIEDILTKAGFILKKNGDHYKQFDVDGIDCDLYITTPACWGVIFTLRTGPADFSKRLVTARRQGGLLPSNLVVKDGRVWNGNMAYETLEEVDFFRVLGLNWIEPEMRR